METYAYNRPDRRGVASVLAMLFLAIISTLAVAMIGLARTSSQISMNQDNVERARANAETGMRWIAWEFASVTMPQTATGTIDNTTATSLWPTIISKILTDTNYGLNNMSSTVLTKKETTTDSNGHQQLHVIVSVPSPYPMDFEILATSGPTAPSWATGAISYTNQAQVIGVQSKGIVYADAAKQVPLVTRIIKGYFLMQKSFRYGVLAKIPIQLGKNTVVEGDIYYAAKPKSGDTQPPVLSISDFRYTSATTSDALTTRIQNFQDQLQSLGYTGSDNRVPLTNPLAAQLQAAGFSDYNNDGYIDEYDVFLKYFDSNANGAVSKTEYLNGAPNDPNLFYLIDQWIGEPPPGTQHTDPSKPNYSAARAGFSDDVLNASDPYAKVTGQVRIWETQAQLSTRLGGYSPSQKIGDVMQGSIVSADGYSAPVLYGQQDTTDPATQITPASFNQAAFLALAGSGGGTAVTPANNPITSKAVPEPDPTYTPLNQKEFANTSVTGSSIANGTIDANIIADMTANGDTGLTYKTVTVYKRDANGNILMNGANPVTQSVQALTQVTENVPYGSTGVRSTVTRPVISGMNFRNCIINRGTNAVFINCQFDGVTFVDGAYTMAQSTSDYPKGNNFRFLNCTFTGPLVQGDATATGSNQGATPTNYTDYTNSWEFNGTTTIDLRPVTNDPTTSGIGSKDGTTDSTALAAIKQQATIQAPQTNIEMGSYTNVGAASCSFQGIVVAGCFDCRGVADIDGSIIVPSTAAGNSTLGYFGPNDNATSQGEPDPTLQNSGKGAYGRIHIRFNPYRTLPDGINLNVSIYPDMKSMEEVTQWQAN